jgi:cobalt-zinc-cadmium efflux system membrane fusion protein
VFVRTATGFTPVVVGLAGQIGDTAYIASGLKPGAQVAITGVAELKSMTQGQ